MKTIRATVAVGLLSLPLALAAHAQGSVEASACLDAVAEASYGEAVILCGRALEAEPENEQLQAAMETAKAAVADTGSVASPPPRESN